MKIKKLTKKQKKILECQKKPFKGDAPINKKSKKKKSCEIYNNKVVNLNDKKIKDHFTECGNIQLKNCKKDKKLSITIKKPKKPITLKKKKNPKKIDIFKELKNKGIILKNKKKTKLANDIYLLLKNNDLIIKKES